MQNHASLTVPKRMKTNTDKKKLLNADSLAELGILDKPNQNLAAETEWSQSEQEF